MDAIITWAKENFDLISLGVGILGVLIGVVSVIQARKQVKQAKKDKMGDFDPEDLRWIVEGEMEYGESLEEE